MEEKGHLEDLFNGGFSNQLLNVNSSLEVLNKWKCLRDQLQNSPCENNWWYLTVLMGTRDTRLEKKVQIGRQNWIALRDQLIEEDPLIKTNNQRPTRDPFAALWTLTLLKNQQIVQSKNSRVDHKRRRVETNNTCAGQAWMAQVSSDTHFQQEKVSSLHFYS